MAKQKSQTDQWTDRSINKNIAQTDKHLLVSQHREMADRATNGQTATAYLTGVFPQPMHMEGKKT